MRLATALAGLIVGFWSCCSWADSTVVWMTANLPPIFVETGKLVHQGWGDLQTDYLIKHLPQFAHILRSGPTARIFHDMHTEDGVCAVAALRTLEREDFALFSERSFEGGGFKLVVRHSQRPLLDPALNGRGEVDLTKLAAIPQFVGGYIGGRVYNAAIMEFVTGPNHASGLERLVDDGQLFGLLHGGRLDYGFALAQTALWYQEQISAPLDLDYLAIHGGTSTGGSYVACSKGPVGRSVIDAVNKLLRQDENWAEFVEPGRRWSTPEEFQQALSSGK